MGISIHLMTTLTVQSSYVAESSFWTWLKVSWCLSPDTVEPCWTVMSSYWQSFWAVLSRWTRLAVSLLFLPFYIIIGSTWKKGNKHSLLFKAHKVVGAGVVFYISSPILKDCLTLVFVCSVFFFFFYFSFSLAGLTLPLATVAICYRNP